MSNPTKDKINSPWSRLSTLPATNWKLVSGTLMCWYTVIFLSILVWNVRERDSVLSSLVDSLLIFSATVAGVLPAAMFLSKRLTYTPGGPDDKRSQVTSAADAADAGVPAPDPEKS